MYMQHQSKALSKVVGLIQYMKYVCDTYSTAYIIQSKQETSTHTKRTQCNLVPRGAVPGRTCIPTYHDGYVLTISLLRPLHTPYT